jgi:hypothetical protein
MKSSPNCENSSKLEQLASARFSGLTVAEIKVLRAVAAGETAICSPNRLINDPRNDPVSYESWGDDRQINAKILRWICTDSLAKLLIDPFGIHVYAARILGQLDLSYVTVPFPLTFANCSFESEFNLRHANLVAVNLQGTHLYELSADGATIKGGFFLRHGFHARGQVRLAAVRIGGNLECDQGTFENPAQRERKSSGTAIVADGAIIQGSIFLRSGFRALGEVRLAGVQIGGCLDCTNASFNNPASRDTSSSGIALNGQGLLAKGYVDLGAGFCAQGETALVAAHIVGNLNMGGAVLSNPEVPSLPGPRAALACDRIIVEGGIFLNQGLLATGEIRLLGAQIGGDLDCAGTYFTAIMPDAPDDRNRALSVHSASIRGNVHLRHGFHSEGTVTFSGSQIAGNLDCTQGHFEGEIELEATSIRDAFFWRKISHPECARLVLTNASAGALADDIRSWPQTKKLTVEGFLYNRFSGEDVPRKAAERLNWLSRQEFFTPQPYRQLAKVLRAEGDTVGARQTLFEMEKRRHAKDSSVWQRFASGLLKNTVGYGYYPFWAFRSLALLMLLGAVLYWSGYLRGDIVPTDKDAYSAYSAFKKQRDLPPQYVRFQPMIYSIENSFPLLKLGQVDYWQPNPSALAATNFTNILRWFRWAQVAFGWILATLFVAGLAGVVRED